MDLYSTVRSAYHVWKRARGRHVLGRMSKVRRIDRVYPPKGERVVAVTFDDGPTVAPARPYSSQGITSLLLDAMKEHGARGTFDVIGSTHENYPDRSGKPGSFTWGGIRFDHYPEFGKDHLAGAANQLDLVRRILDEGHEISNHGYRHVAFGPHKLIYGSRAYFNTIGEVYDDLKKLHDLMMDKFNYAVKLARPPHYIDRIPDGHTSFDVYEIMGYQYLGASFDGGGWRASRQGSQKEVHNMVDSLRAALEADPDSLSGQIIFEKDGYNMSLEAPVVEALPQKLALLKSHGYRVVSVSELMAISPYSDIGPDHESFFAVRLLERMGLPVLYRDNTFRAYELAKVSDLVSWLGRDRRKPYDPEGKNRQLTGERRPESRTGGDVFGSDLAKDQVLTVGALLKMVPQSAVSACGIKTRDKEQGVPRWMAAIVSVETLRLESDLWKDYANE